MDHDPCDIPEGYRRPVRRTAGLQARMDRQVAVTHVCRCKDSKVPHPTFGACMRAKNIRVAYCQSAAGQDYTQQKRWDQGLSAYADARRQGIQPESTRPSAVDTALRLSDARGEAYRADVTSAPGPSVKVA